MNLRSWYIVCVGTHARGVHTFSITYSHNAHIKILNTFRSHNHTTSHIYTTHTSLSADKEHHHCRQPAREWDGHQHWVFRQRRGRRRVVCTKRHDGDGGPVGDGDPHQDTYVVCRCRCRCRCSQISFSREHVPCTPDIVLIRCCQGAVGVPMILEVYLIVSTISTFLSHQVPRTGVTFVMWSTRTTCLTSPVNPAAPSTSSRVTRVDKAPGALSMTVQTFVISYFAT